MKNKDKINIGILDRTLTGVFSSVLMFLTCVVVTMALIKGAPTAAGEFLFDTWYWKLSFIFSGIAGVIGFLKGGARMMQLFGALWGTNKPKDGNWL